MENNIIELYSVNKSFKQLKAVDDVSFTIKQGTITAILGPNASGKTTALKCILGLVIPDSGEIRVGGMLVGLSSLYRQFIGYMPQIANFPDNVSSKALLTLLGYLRKSTPAATELIELFGLGKDLLRPVRELSGGTRQKISAMCALSFGAEILILDEPTVGLDPVSSIYLKDKILEARANGATVLLTSHVMSEVEELSDNIVFLLDGKVHFQGQVNELRRVTGEEKMERAIARLMTNGRSRVHA